MKAWIRATVPSLHKLHVIELYFNSLKDLFRDLNAVLMFFSVIAAKNKVNRNTEYTLRPTPKMFSL